MMGSQYMRLMVLLSLVAVQSMLPKSIYIIYNQTNEPITYNWKGYSGSWGNRKSVDHIGTLQPGESRTYEKIIEPWSTSGNNYDYFRSEGSHDTINGFALTIADADGNIVFEGAPKLDAVNQYDKPLALSYASGTSDHAAAITWPLGKDLNLGRGVKESPEEAEEILKKNGYGLIIKKIVSDLPFLGNFGVRVAEVYDPVRNIGKNQRIENQVPSPSWRPYNIVVKAVYPKEGKTGAAKYSIQNYYLPSTKQNVVLWAKE